MVLRFYGYVVMRFYGCRGMRFYALCAKLRFLCVIHGAPVIINV